MHELAITSSIVEQVAEAAAERRVRRVTIVVGRLSGVMSDAVAFCFPEVARGTSLEGAALDIIQIDGRAHCRACGAEFACATFYTPCSCGSVDLDWIEGGELLIKSMELETV